MSVLGVIPSMFAFPPGWLFTAFPKMTSPPQSPSERAPAASLEVKIIGLLTVPSAMIFEPLVTISVPCVVLSPRIIVPGAIVNVTPPLT